MPMRVPLVMPPLEEDDPDPTVGASVVAEPRATEFLATVSVNVLIVKVNEGSTSTS
jgi:hypothetical protein